MRPTRSAIAPRARGPDTTQRCRRAPGLLQRLAGRLLPRTLYVRGRLARLAYWLLSRRHLCTVHGWQRTLWLTLAQRIARRVGPRVKLH